MRTTIEIEDVHRGPHTVDVAAGGTLICDIDGTIADLTHRRVFIATRPKNYPAFEKRMPLDAPIWRVIHPVRELYHAGWNVIMCSGRGAQNRDVTVDWLKKHGVLYHALYMRAEGDYRNDGIIKSELLDQILADGWKPTLVFDDRNRVVEMWRERGLTCVQVAPGDF